MTESTSSQISSVRPLRPEVRYREESFTRCIYEFMQLIDAHYRELAEDKDVIKLEPDWSKYIELEARGELYFCTARDIENELIGYFIALIGPHLHYKSSLTATTDIFFIRSDHRGGKAGYNLIKQVIADMKDRGVQRFFIGCKVKHDLGPLFAKLGFTHVENYHSMILGD